MNLQYGLPKLPAGTDLDQHRLLKVVSGELVVTAAIADVPYGVCPVSVKGGESVSAQRGLVVEYAIASAAIAAGALLYPTANGEVVTATTGGTTFARAIDAATAAGDLIRIEFATLYD